jgi:hypothetical protein
VTGATTLSIAANSVAPRPLRPLREPNSLHSPPTLRHYDKMTSAYRPEFEAALHLFARVSEAMDQRGLPRPVLVGGAAAELYTTSALTTGDFDFCSPVQSELEEEMQRLGFVRPSGAGSLLKGWIHPELLQ